MALLNTRSVKTGAYLLTLSLATNLGLTPLQDWHVTTGKSSSMDVSSSEFKFVVCNKLSILYMSLHHENANYCPCLCLYSLIRLL